MNKIKDVERGKLYHTYSGCEAYHTKDRIWIWLDGSKSLMFLSPSDLNSYGIFLFGEAKVYLSYDKIDFYT